jgi:hypothetical protein
VQTGSREVYGPTDGLLLQHNRISTMQAQRVKAESGKSSKIKTQKFERNINLRRLLPPGAQLQQRRRGKITLIFTGEP